MVSSDKQLTGKRSSASMFRTKMSARIRNREGSITVEHGRDGCHDRILYVERMFARVERSLVLRYHPEVVWIGSRDLGAVPIGIVKFR